MNSRLPHKKSHLIIRIYIDMKSSIWTSTLIYFLLFFGPNCLSGQDYSEQQLDSLDALTLDCNLANFQAFKELASHYYYYSKYSKMRKYLGRQLKCYKSIGNKDYIYETLYFHLMYHQRFPRIDSLMFIADEIFEMAENDTTLNAIRMRSGTLQMVGAQYYKLDQVETGFNYYQKALDQSFNDGLFDIYLTVVSDLINYYLSQDEYEKATQLIDEALSKIPDPNDEKNESILKYVNKQMYLIEIEGIHFNRAKITLLNSNDVVEKRKAYNVFLNYMEANQDRPSLILYPLTVIMSSLKDILPLDTLLMYGEMGVELDKDYEEKDPFLYLYHGKNLIQVNKYAEAEQTLQTALELMQIDPNWFSEIASTYDALADVNLKLGNTTKTKEYFDQYKLYIDSAYTRKNRTNVETIETKYALSQQEAENQRITAEAETLNQRLKFLVLVGLLLFLLLGLALLFYQRQKKSAQNLLRLNQTKDKIFAILGHDLRAPSQVFNNLTKNLSYLIRKKDFDSLLGMASHYEKTGLQLSKMINGVLNWALAENESFLNNPEKVDIEHIIVETLNELEWNLKEKNISVNLDFAEVNEVTFDTNALRIISRNIIQNAIKYSSENSEISIRYDEKGKALEYIDKGIGMSEKHRLSILNGTPVASSVGTKDESGIGVGLVTCLKLVKLNQAEISFLQNSPKGTIVRLGFKSAV